MGLEVERVAVEILPLLNASQRAMIAARAGFPATCQQLQMTGELKGKAIALVSEKGEPFRGYVRSQGYWRSAQIMHCTISNITMNKGKHSVSAVMRRGNVHEMRLDREPERRPLTPARTGAKSADRSCPGRGADSGLESRPLPPMKRSDVASFIGLLSETTD